MFKSVAAINLELFVSKFRLIANQATRTISTKLVDIHIDKNSGVGTVRMQKPPVNSMTVEFLLELSSAFQELEKNNCKGIILTSALKSVFCAGGDISEMYGSTRERQKTYWTALQDAWIKIYASSCPTVAVINGHSPGGGCLLALSCEYRIMMNSEYMIGLNETAHGIYAPKWVREPMLTAITKRQGEFATINGRMFTAKEALQIGLIDKLATHKTEALSYALEYIALSTKVCANARNLTKQYLRSDIITWLQNNKENDFEEFFGFVNQREQQDVLGQYFKALKKKGQVKPK